MKPLRALLMVGVLVTVVAASLLLNQEPRSHNVHAAGGGGSCPNLYFQGGYGFAGHGFTTTSTGQIAVALAGGFLAIPNLTAGATDGTIVGGSETLSRQGAISRLGFTGTFQMAATRCGGSAVLTTSTALTLHYDFWVNQWSSGLAQEVDFIRTDPGNTIQLTVTHV